jgi:transcriptional regulator with XRE-family HTH domain
MLSKDEFTEKFSKRLKTIRNSKKISQEELAYRAGLYRTYVGHLENARYSPSGHVIYKIAKALKISATELFSF